MRIFKFLAIVAVAVVSAFGVKAQSMTNDFTRVYMLVMTISGMELALLPSMVSSWVVSITSM